MLIFHITKAVILANSGWHNAPGINSYGYICAVTLSQAAILAPH